MSDTAQIDDDDEIEFIDHEVDDEEVEKQGAAAKPRALVVVDNLDDGDRIRLWIRFDVKVKRAIARVYKKLDVERSPGDRLTRADNGDSAFEHEDQTIRKYILEHGGKSRIHWEYAGDTGGA